MKYYNRIMSMIEDAHDEGKTPLAWEMHPQDLLDIRKTANLSRGHYTETQDNNPKLFGIPIEIDTSVELGEFTLRKAHL